MASQLLLLLASCFLGICSACVDIPVPGEAKITDVAPAQDSNDIHVSLTYTENVTSSRTEVFVFEVASRSLSPVHPHSPSVSLTEEMGSLPKSLNFSFDAVNKSIRLHDLGGRTVSLSSINQTIQPDILYFVHGETLFFIVGVSGSAQWLVSTDNTSATSATVNIVPVVPVFTDEQSHVRVFSNLSSVRLPTLPESCCDCDGRLFYNFYNFSTSGLSERPPFTYYDHRDETLVSFTATSISVEFVANSSASFTTTLSPGALRSFFVAFQGYTDAEMLPFQSPCRNDTQCVPATNGCCDCANGGQESAVLESHKSAYDRDLADNCGTMTMCSDARWPPCFAPYAGSAQCVDGRCQWGPPTVPGLSSNWSLWNATVSSWNNSYEFSFRRSCECLEEDTQWTSLTVVDGQVVNASPRISSPRIDGDVTIEWVLQTIQDAIDYPSFEIRVTFSPEFGYPTQVYIDWEEDIADEESIFDLKSVRPYVNDGGNGNDGAGDDGDVAFGLGVKAMVGVAVGGAVAVVVLAGLGAWVGYRRGRGRVTRAPDYLANARISDLPDADL